MAALGCELCGGKLVGKPGGIFECDSCGMEYSTEWAKAKIQEIKGTVKVEGTVDVTGTVKVDGSVKVDTTGNIDNLIKRGFIALEDQEYMQATECFTQASILDPERGVAYVGLALAETCCTTIEQLARKQYVAPNSCPFCGGKTTQLESNEYKCDFCGYITRTPDRKPQKGRYLERAERCADAETQVYLLRYSREQEALQAKAEEKAMRQREEKLRPEQKRLEQIEAFKKKNAVAEADSLSKKKTQLHTKKEHLREELSNLKGLFSSKRRKEIEAQLIEINNELKGL